MSVPKYNLGTRIVNKRGIVYINKNFIDLGYLAQEDKRSVYVLDTNVLLHDPASIFRFEEHIVLIPFIAIEEIDAKKSDPGIGYNARDISQKLEKLAIKEHNTPAI